MIGPMIGPMAMRILDPTRREVMAGLGAVLGASAAGRVAGAATPPASARLTLQARRATLALRLDQPVTAISELAAVSPSADIRLKRGDRCEIVFQNRLQVPLTPHWYGLEGAADPLLLRGPVAIGKDEKLIISMPQAGTLMAGLRLFDDVLKPPARPLPIIVGEAEPVAVDRDELYLIEDWRLAADGTAIPPGAAGGSDSTPIYTVNGKLAPDLTLRPNERLRLRLINGCQRAVVAVKIEGLNVMVMALDGQPAEPFAARNGALVLAPGSRADVFLDGTAPPGSAMPVLLHDGKEARPIGRLTIAGEPLRPNRLAPPAPLPSNGLPEHLDLRGAVRFDVALAATEVGWTRPASFTPSAAPAFRAKAGRTVVLALKNPGPVTIVFHLHGHHFRLLDRLDDGWKPYWLDTLAVEPGQTQRIAFATSYPGRWLMESVVADWAAPRLVRWLAVE